MRQLQDSLAPVGFNLSILECKFALLISSTLCLHCFNLSILECKSDTVTVQEKAQFVLIYPYWNVNLRQNSCHSHSRMVLIYPYWNVNYFRETEHGLRARFNLSILECKYQGFKIIRTVAPVLIYPYWNVNSYYLISKVTQKSVLIYPYWNVNNTAVNTV